MSGALLYAVRLPPIGWTEVRAALEALERETDGLTCTSGAGETAGPCEIAFWGVPRVDVMLAQPYPDDARDDLPELSHPYVEVSARSQDAPWVAWTATALAAKLGARVYDPYEGELRDDGEPAPDLAALRRHDGS